MQQTSTKITIKLQYDYIKQKSTRQDDKTDEYILREAEHAEHDHRPKKKCFPSNKKFVTN